MRVEKWRHLLHVVDAADKRPLEHVPVRRHAQHGMSKKEGRGKEGHSVRSLYTAVLCGRGGTCEWVMC